MDFRIPPIIGEINHNENKFVIIYVVRYDCLLNIKLKRQNVDKYIPSNKDKVTRLIMDLNDRLSKETIEYYINDHLVFTNIINLNSNHVLTFVSCDYGELDIKHSLWDAIRGYNPDVCFHLGDNIYGDAAFETGVKILNKHKQKRDKRIRSGKYPIDYPTNACEVRYRETYEKTWNRWARKLNNTSHIMMWDDHDVTEGYNTIKEDEEEDVVKKLMYYIGRNMYQEYQESLRLDNGGNYDDPIFKYRINRNVHVFMLDRISNISGTNRPFSNELALLLSADLQNIEKGTIILAFGSAPIPQVRNYKAKPYRKIFGTDALWNEKELTTLYTILFNWMKGDNDNNSNQEEKRNAVIIGGDIHIGVSGEIKNKDDRVIPFFITSPVSNHPTIIEKIYTSGYEAHIDVNGFDVNIAQAKARRNFLLANVDSKGRFTANLLFAQETYPSNPANLITEGMKMKGMIKT